MVEYSKPFYKSKTLWFNAVTGILAAFQAVVPSEYVVLVNVVGNILLRFVTTQPVAVL